MAATAETTNYDRALAVREFDESKTGVKGLVDAGITSIPPIFVHPNLSLSSSQSLPPPNLSIPIIDLSLPRSRVVELVRSAARTLGFFQVTNHSVPLPLIDRSIAAVRSFNELPLDTRSQFYSRQFQGGVLYATNYDLFRSSAASWRDTIQIVLGPTRPDPERIPAVMREEVLELDERLKEAGREVMGLLAEGLGVDAGRLEEMTCHEGRFMVCHYYPWCPEPERTLGLTGHTDSVVLTVLVQDDVGGLQVKVQSAWVDVKPVPGALVINVGDLLQIISNDEYKSIQHRVLANTHKQGRVSLAIFFEPGKRGENDLYGPLSELVSAEKPLLYRNFTVQEYQNTLYRKELGAKTLVDCFKL